MTQVFDDPLQDAKNLERAKLLHSPVRLMCFAHLASAWKNAGIYLRVTQTLRTFQEQDDLYQLGRTRPGKKVTNARAGYSWHNYGLAYDIVILNPDGSANWNTSDPKWLQIAKLGKDEGLIWGGDWVTIQDYPHFEYHPGFDSARQALAVWNKKGIDGVYDRLARSVPA